MKPGVEGIVTYVQLNDSLLPALVPPIIENVVGPAANGTNPASAVLAGGAAEPPVDFDDEHERTASESAAARTRGRFTADRMT
jgi:hypothetical protein